ncbi:MAG: molybdenum cofactor biosynthesis protein MoaE [Candidatus Eremiobacteraeota bacterium]|nr:molybdenum cofactor biosynthesis protein MoaE [Candidatus Eremiobacteraeota bacterium]
MGDVAGRAVGQIHTAIVERPLDPVALLAAVADPGHGATALFVGTVREVNDGRAVTGIEYTAYEAMAARELAAIVAEGAERYSTVEGAPRIAAEHRLGTLGVGEASVAVAASHARRAPALDAVRYVVEELKQRVPIWKREHYVDGTREWLDPTSATAAAASEPAGAGA